MARIRLMTLMIVLACCPARMAAAQDAPAPPEPTQDAEENLPQDPPPTQAQWVEQLAHADFGQRVEATRALMRDNTLDEAALRERLLANDHPERRRRLMMIAQHHLMRALVMQAAEELREPDFIAPEPGAVGFSYDPLLPDNNPHTTGAAFIVLDTMPGFPGHAFLLPGDVITAIDGRSSRSNTVTSIRNWVGGAIGRHNSSGRVTMTVYREGEPVELTIPCASINALNEIYVTTGQGGTTRRDNYQELLDQAMARLTEGLGELEALTPEP